MKKFEYMVFNLSELKPKKATKDEPAREGRNIVQRMNELGQDGWDLKIRLTDSSFLLQRELRPAALV